MSSRRRAARREARTFSSASSKGAMDVYRNEVQRRQDAVFAPLAKSGAAPLGVAGSGVTHFRKTRNRAPPLVPRSTGAAKGASGAATSRRFGRSFSSFQALLIWKRSGKNLTVYQQRLLEAMRARDQVLKFENQTSTPTDSTTSQLASATILARHRLIRDPAVRAAVDRFWHSVYKEVDDGLVYRGEYVSLQRRVYRALMPEFTSVQAAAVAEEEFELDRRGAVGLDYQRFYLALFEIADTWCDERDAREYGRFLLALYKQITRPPPATGWMDEVMIAPLVDDGDDESLHAAGQSSMEDAARMYEEILTEQTESRNVMINVASAANGGRVIDVSSIFDDRFQASNLLNDLYSDGPRRSWASKGEGTGAFVRVRFDMPYRIESIGFQQRTARLNHIAKVRLDFDDGSRQYIDIDSRTDLMRCDLAPPVRTSTVRVTVESMHEPETGDMVPNAGACAIEFWTSVPRAQLALQQRKGKGDESARAPAAVLTGKAVEEAAVSDEKARRTAHEARRPSTTRSSGGSSSFSRRSVRASPRVPFTPRAMSRRQVEWNKPHETYTLERVMLERARQATEWEDDDVHANACLLDLVEDARLPEAIVDEHADTIRALASTPRPTTPYCSSLASAAAEARRRATTPRPRPRTAAPVKAIRRPRTAKSAWPERPARPPSGLPRRPRTAISAFLAHHDASADASVGQRPMGGGMPRIPPLDMSRVVGHMDESESEEEEEVQVAAVDAPKPESAPVRDVTLGRYAPDPVAPAAEEEASARAGYVSVHDFNRARERPTSPRAFWRPDTPGGAFESHEFRERRRARERAEREEARIAGVMVRAGAGSGADGLGVVEAAVPVEEDGEVFRQMARRVREV